MNLDFIISTFLILLASTMFVLILVRLRGINTAKLFALFFHLTAIAMSVVSLAFFTEEIVFSEFNTYRSNGFIILQSFILAGVSLLSINGISSKKVKTVWRIPIIGVLLGFFDSVYHNIITFACLTLILFVFLKNRSTLRIIGLRIIVHVMLSISYVMSEGFNFWVSESFLILILLNIYPVWDMLFLKQKITRNS